MRSPGPRYGRNKREKISNTYSQLIPLKNITNCLMSRRDKLSVETEQTKYPSPGTDGIKKISNAYTQNKFI
jgi:hypothetical protein